MSKEVNKYGRKYKEESKEGRKLSKQTNKLYSAEINK